MWARAIFEIDAEYYVLQEDYDELEEENKKLKEELNHYKNTEAIQNSNRKSRYTPEEQELLNLDYGTWFTAKFVRK